MKRSGPPQRKVPLKRTPMRRTPGPAAATLRTDARPRKPLRQQSAKRRAENRVRDAVKRRLVAERGPWCQARLDGCDGLAVDAHELLARSAVGSITDESNIILVCRSCHDWIGAHPREATALGLRRSRYGGAA